MLILKKANKAVSFMPILIAPCIDNQQIALSKLP